MPEDTCPERTPAEAAAIQELGAWVDELRAGTREQAIDGIHTLLTQVRETIEGSMGEMADVVKNYDAEWQKFATSDPRCIHCDCAIPVDRDEHWRECPKHPARVAMIQAGNAMAMSKFLIEDLTYRIHGTRYDWNADPDEMTRRTGDVLKAVDEIREMTKVLPLADYPPAPTKPSPLEEALAPHVGSVMALIASDDAQRPTT